MCGTTYAPLQSSNTLNYRRMITRAIASLHTYHRPLYHALSTVNGFSRSTELTKLRRAKEQARPILFENFRIGQSLSNRMKSDGRLEFESNLESLGSYQDPLISYQINAPDCPPAAPEPRPFSRQLSMPSIYANFHWTDFSVMMENYFPQRPKTSSTRRYTSYTALPSPLNDLLYRGIDALHGLPWQPCTEWYMYTLSYAGADYSNIAGP